MEFPGEVWRIVRRFAYEPTPSAKAFRAAFQGDAVVEARAPMFCGGCQLPLPRCFRKWTFAEDGRVTMHFGEEDGLCPWCLEDADLPCTGLVQTDVCAWL